MSTATISSKNQIVIPKKVRQLLKLKSGSVLSIYPISDTKALITKEPENPVLALKGLGKEIWQKHGGADKYICQERQSWKGR